MNLTKNQEERLRASLASVLDSAPAAPDLDRIVSRPQRLVASAQPSASARAVALAGLAAVVIIAGLLVSRSLLETPSLGGVGAEPPSDSDDTVAVVPTTGTIESTLATTEPDGDSSATTVGTTGSTGATTTAPPAGEHPAVVMESAVEGMRGVTYLGGDDPGPSSVELSFALESHRYEVFAVPVGTDVPYLNLEAEHDQIQLSGTAAALYERDGNVEVVFETVGLIVRVRTEATTPQTALVDAASRLIESLGVQQAFVGLGFDEAVALAETEGRGWQLSRRDDEIFGVNDDLEVGRVTFEVDDGVVTGVSVG